MIGVVVAPGRRLAVGDRRIRRGAERPVDVARRKAPGDGEAHFLAPAGRNRHARRQRAVLGLQAHMPRQPRLVVMPLRQPAGSCEFLPEHREVVEPLAAVVKVGVVDVVGVGGDGQVAAIGRLQILVRRGQAQRADAVLALECVDAAVGAIVAERSGQRVGQLVAGVVDQLELEHGDRHRAVVVVVRDERRQRRQAHAAREALVLEHQIGGREAAIEIDLAEMRHADQRLPVGAVAEAVEHFAQARRPGGIEVIGAVQHARVDQLAVLLCLDGEMRIAVVALQRRPVADRPVDQPAASRDREAAGADPAQRKRDVAGALALVGKARIDGSKVVPHEICPVGLLRVLSS